MTLEQQVHQNDVKLRTAEREIKYLKEEIVKLSGDIQLLKAEVSIREYNNRMRPQ